MGGKRRLAVALGALALVAGCGDGEDPPPATADAERTADAGERAPDEGDSPRVGRVACPPEVAGCASARGEIVYVEKVDPDGDGDAHFVLTSEQSVTAPGITVVDVRADLRPDPLPEPGDALAAAGPVYPGSYGQRQIEAVAVRVARAD